MHRLLALLVPVIVLITSVPHAATSAPVAPDRLGEFWSASVKAEENKNYDESIAAMKAFRESGGDAFLAMLRLGWLQYQAGRYLDAYKAYEKAGSLAPLSLNARLGSLNAAQSLLDVRATVVAAEGVLKIEPTNYRALMALAGIYYAQKDFRKAASGYARVLVNYPDDPDARSGAAWSSLQVGDKRGAESAFRLLLSMYPSYPQAREGYQLCNGGKP